MRVLCPLSLPVFRAPHMQLPCILSGLRRSDFKATPSIYIYSTYMVKWAGGDFKTLRFLCYGVSRTPNSVELNRRFCKNVIPTQMHIITYVYVCVYVCVWAFQFWLFRSWLSRSPRRANGFFLSQGRGREMHQENLKKIFLATDQLALVLRYFTNCLSLFNIKEKFLKFIIP